MEQEHNSTTQQVLDMLQVLARELKTIRELAKYEPEKYESDETHELAAALAKAQAEMSVAGCDAQNPYFKSKYADLTSVVKASRPALAANNLSVTQQVAPNKEGQNMLITKLHHASGQWIKSSMRILPPKNDIQTLGSYITYLRRYSYAALVGVVAGSEDDDGEMAVAVTRYKEEKGTGVNTKYNPKEQSYDTISKEQLEELEYELEEYPDIGQMVLEKLQLQSLADMPKTKYRASIERVREIKNLRNNTAS